MSSIGYGILTTRRIQATPSMAAAPSQTGVTSYIDAAAALVPAEVLSLHAVILSFTTEVSGDTTKITDTTTLQWAFGGLIILSILLYLLPRYKTWTNLDYIRLLIPPIAFTAWTMLQRSTAFDAFQLSITDGVRTVIALFIVVLLGLLVAYLAGISDKSVPPVV